MLLKLFNRFTVTLLLYSLKCPGIQAERWSQNRRQQQNSRSPAFSEEPYIDITVDLTYYDECYPVGSPQGRILNGAEGMGPSIKDQTRRKLILNQPSYYDSVIMYSHPNCNDDPSPHKQAYLQFFNVSQQQFLLTGTRTNPPEIRLLNYNICPVSVKRQEQGFENFSWEHYFLDFKVVLSHIDKNPSNSQELYITNSTTSACKPLSFPKDQNMYITKVQLKLQLSQEQSNYNGIVCIELFSGERCSGKVARFLVPSSAQLWDQEEHGRSVIIWEYEGQPVPADLRRDKSQIVNSIRTCPSTLRPENGYFQTSTQPPTVETSKAGHTESALIAQHEKCRCMIINRISKSPDTKPNCYNFYNGTLCNTTVVTTQKNITEKDLSGLAKKFTFFKEWRFEECHSECQTDKRRPVVYPNEKLEDILPKWNHREVSESIGFFHIATMIVGVLICIMLLAVLILSYMLWRKKRIIEERRQRCVAFIKPQTGQRRVLNHSDTMEVNDYINDVGGLGALCGTFADKYEIPRECINIGNMRDSTAPVIGVGECSVVFKGRLEPHGQTVAVKTLKSGQATTRLVKEALKECHLLMQLGKHTRILEFLGVCTQFAKRGEIYIVMAWCEHGSLRGFLAQQKKYFVNLVQDGEWLQDDKLEKGLAAKSSIAAGPPITFNSLQLMKWCYEVADAMEFLAVRKIVLITLNARNVMLDEKFSAKISNFHLAKAPGDGVPVGHFCSLTRRKDCAIPWRWCAIESLVDELFSTESDVWSYGVFMWEVFSLGAMPYPEYTFSSEFTLCIKHGYRLQSPNFSPLECYQLMLICWYDAPEKRPCFTKIKERILELTPKKNVPISSGRFQVVRTLSKTSTSSNK